MADLNKRKKCAPDSNRPIVISHVSSSSPVRRFRFETFTYGQTSMAIALQVSKINSKHDKLIPRTWINSS